MNRFRFYVPDSDHRPLTFPAPNVGPYWCSGCNDTHQIVVAYAESLEAITAPTAWPDAEDIDDQGPQKVVFTDRFPKPDWWPLTAAE